MKLLLDTQAFIWYVAGDGRLPKRVLRAVADQRNRVLFSVVSAWEIAVKQRAGRLGGVRPLDVLIEDGIRLHGFQTLDVRLEHALRLTSLPWLHGDPFDRMLVAQAIEDRCVMVSRDRALAEYPVETLW